MSTPASAQTEVVRKRRFAVSSLEEVADVLRQMRNERFQGVVRIDFRCGGTPTSAEVEERSKVDLTRDEP